jgi:hypothetical protein
MVGRALCVHAPGLVPGVPAIFAPAEGAFFIRERQQGLGDLRTTIAP